MIKALVFDFDGLILDTEQPIYNSWLEVYQAHGVQLPFDLWVQNVGSTNVFFHPQKHLEETLGRPLPEAVLKERIRRRTELVLAEPIRPGVCELIDAIGARGLRLGVASSSTQEWVGGHLERLGLRSRFECLRCRDDVEHPKPWPDVYVAAVECLGVAPSEAVAIEDSPHGIKAAKAAGLYAVGVPNSVTAGLDLGAADLQVASLASIALDDLLNLAHT
jgi:HAD superfamily hydrolase (TIGR01509 family)